MNLDKLKVSEKTIENEILNWLAYKNIYAWKTKTVGTFDVRTKRFLRPSKLYRTGVSDIIGVLPTTNGKIFAIEVKSRTGSLKPHQKEFLDEINSRGGLAFVAKCLKDVEEQLKVYL